jgi:hypothetical protein
MRIKPGVRVFGLRPEMVLALVICESIYRKYGVEVVITSGIEGKHQRGSFHYAGDAADIRIRNLPADVSVAAVRNEIADALGQDFDVVLEKDHIHIEFDPKAPYTGA